jgi:hypothetical protein
MWPTLPPFLSLYNWCIRLALSVQPPAHAGSSFAEFTTLKMEAIRSSETSVHTITTWNYTAPHHRKRHSSTFGEDYKLWLCSQISSSLLLFALSYLQLFSSASGSQTRVYSYFWVTDPVPIPQFISIPANVYFNSNTVGSVGTGALYERGRSDKIEVFHLFFRLLEVCTGS